MLQLNTGNLYAIMRDFHILTGIRIVIFDSDFRELLAYPTDRERFCTLLRQTPEGNAACQRSDMEGCRACADSKEPVIYRCHAGLTEAVVPIFDKGSVLAYVMFGQILQEDSDGKMLRLLKSRYPHLSEAADLLPVKSQMQLQAAATVLQAITGHMMTNRWVAPEKSEFIRQLDVYLLDHLSCGISVEEICRAFRVGRTRLYELCADYLGCGLAEYIRAYRIRHAQTLLRQTDRSITQIALDTGFSDYNHFSKVFKQYTGISAREYKKTASR